MTDKVNDIIYRLKVLPEDVPVRGNLCVSGDDTYDKQMEDCVIRRANAGDAWAWCTVEVTATLDGFTGTDYLGACSYRDEESFRGSGYYADMLVAARAALFDSMRGAVSRGQVAAAFLLLFEEAP